MEPENTPKVIELKEFVEEAISQIVDGITAACFLYYLYKEKQ